MDEATKRILTLSHQARATDLVRREAERITQLTQLVNDPVVRQLAQLQAHQLELDRITRLWGENPAGRTATAHAHAISESIVQTIARDTERFKNYLRPDLSAVEQILNAYPATLHSGIEPAAQRFRALTLSDSLVETVRRMEQPWLDQIEPARSLGALAEIDAIATNLRTLEPYGEPMMAMARRDFGDWRDPIAIPEIVFEDPFARTAFYADQGFDLELVEFPVPAYDEALTNTGMKSNPPAAIPGFMPPVPVDEIESIELNSDVYKWLAALESQLRKAIQTLLVAQYGENWVKRLPPDVLADWNAKQEKAKQHSDDEYPLIVFADFTHYEKIICKKDLFREVFSVFFARMEDARESFQRLYGIRLSVMHGRYVTKADQLLVYSEVTRLSRVWTRH